MEDARFVRFTDEDGTIGYRATYTAYDGRDIAPRLITSPDLTAFAIHRLTGTGARNKGMALFPRLVGGRHLALSRTDGENISLARSADGVIWDDLGILHRPTELWELVQLGNCGAPIETDRGWLVLTHGVGPLRTYSLGALLLDLDDPSRVIARYDDAAAAADRRLCRTATSRASCTPAVGSSTGGSCGFPWASGTPASGSSRSPSMTSSRRWCDPRRRGPHRRRDPHTALAMPTGGGSTPGDERAARILHREQRDDVATGHECREPDDEHAELPLPCRDREHVVAAVHQPGERTRDDQPLVLEDAAAQPERGHDAERVVAVVSRSAAVQGRRDVRSRGACPDAPRAARSAR